ncbi:hypothetical protein MTO96_015989 [Rhipicephalus appendiculatus]
MEARSITAATRTKKQARRAPNTCHDWREGAAQAKQAQAEHCTSRTEVEAAYLPGRGFPVTVKPAQTERENRALKATQAAPPPPPTEPEAMHASSCSDDEQETRSDVSGYTSAPPRSMRVVSTAVQSRSWARLLVSLTAVALWVSLHSAATLLGASSGIVQPSSAAEGKLSDEVPVVLSLNTARHSVSVAALALVAVAALVRLSYLTKIAFLVLLCVLQCALCLLPPLSEHFTAASLEVVELVGTTETPTATLPVGQTKQEQRLLSHAAVQLIYLVAIGLALAVISRQFELTSRRLFLWRKDVEEQKEKVADMRRKNEALVYNVLPPPHVAKVFLGRRRLDEELYSKSHDSVGVLFAAMPNFSDFYTEESVNNQGLECLRFLNEVISDFDALLEQNRFQDILKIKTIGSSYMAASGLSKEDEPKDGASIQERWGHLAQLTDFALALKDTLNNINRESFNNFVLKMGINHGPITSGVIGARKPHFDIWGNTVNVASRMESTGKAGNIQASS